jgi:MFS family permease
LTWASFASVPLVIGCAVGLGISSAFSAPASQALIGDLVPRSELQSAVALNSMTFNLARAIGPTLAGVSVDQLGFAPSFAINAASYLVLALGLTIVQPRARELAGRGAARLRDSLRLVRQQPRLLAFLLIVTAVGFGSDPVNTEAPAFASTFSLHPPRLWTGIVVGAFGAGAVTAAFLVAGRVAGSRRRMTITLSLLGAGVAAFALSPTIWLGLAFLAVGGFGYLASNTAATSRLQLDVAEHHRGRIMALWSVAFLGLRPVASLLDGALAGAFGVRTAGVVLALPAFACAAAILTVPRLAGRVGDASRSAGA